MAGNPLLTRLKQYKEFIAIVAAAIGGFVWFDGLVAKQADLEAIDAKLADLAERRDIEALQTTVAELAPRTSVELLSCLLTNYMTLSQRQLRLAQLNSELTRQERELGFLSLETKIGLEAQLVQTIANQSATRRDEIQKLRDEIALEDRSIREIRDFLERHGCDDGHS